MAFPPTLTAAAADSHQADYRRRLAEFARSSILIGSQSKSDALFDLLPTLGISDYLPVSARMPDGIRLIGKATKDQVNELFFPKSFDARERLNHNGRRTMRRGSGPGRRRIFVGKDWDNLITMPFFDSASQICGFLLVGRNADLAAGDVIFKAAAFNRPRGGIREAGLAFASVLNAPTTTHFPNDVFIFVDPLAALELHVRWLRSNLRRLPLVAAYCDKQHRTRTSFTQLGLARQRIVFAPVANDDLFVTARYADARVALPPEDISPGLYQTFPLAWLRLLKKHAVPWRDAVRAELRRREAADAASLIRKLDLRPGELWEFVASCDAHVRGKLAASGDELLLAPRANARDEVIVETSSSWLIERSGVQICSASVRIEETLVTKDKRLYYRGIVRLNNSTVPFVVPEPAVTKLGLFRCVKQFLERAGVGELNYLRSWNRFAEQIAMQLHTPTNVRLADVVGWHEARLVLPRFTILLGGHIVQDRGVKLIGPDTPARSIEPPAELTRAQLRPVTVITPITAMFWGIITHFAHNITAGLARRKPVGLVLTGAGAAGVADAIVSALDCARFQMPRSLWWNRANDELERRCKRDDWPTVIAPPPGRATHALSHLLAEPDGRNFVIDLNWYAAQVAATHGWRVIEIDDAAELVKLLHDFGRDVLVSYLQDICRRRMSAAGHPAGWFSVILRDLANWIGLVGRGKQAVMEAREVMDVDRISPPWQPLMAIVRKFLADGDLPVAKGRIDQMWELPDKVICNTGAMIPASVWIPTQRLDKLLAKKNAPPLGQDSVLEALSRADAIVEVKDYGPELYWIVKRRWWNRQILRPIGLPPSMEFSEAS